MPQRTDSFDLARLNLRSGEGRRLELHAPLAGLSYGGSPYEVTPSPAPVTLDVSRTTHNGYALRMRFDATLRGPVHALPRAGPADPPRRRARGLPARRRGRAAARPTSARRASSTWRAWARDALSLAVPDQIACKPDCLGLCPICGEDLNDAPGHEHEREPDPRWAKLRELKFD